MMEASKTPGESYGDSASSMPLPEGSAAHDKCTGGKAVVRELGLVRATAHVVSADTWKDQLNFDRACSAAMPGGRCWLSGELTSWNLVLHRLVYELVEMRPGSVRLRKIEHGAREIGKDKEDAAREASFLISWLLEHHLCINEFSLFYDSHYGHKTPPVPFPIRVRPSLGSSADRYFRHVKIELAEHGYTSWITVEKRGHLFALEGLSTVRGVEKLKVTSSIVTFKFAAELESLLRCNASTLKAVKITKAMPRNVDYALRCLVNCESLTLCPNFGWGRRVPSMVSVAQLLRTTSALKNLIIYICPIKKKKQFITIAEAIKANTSLRKLSVRFVEIICSPEPVFVALQANGTLKELQLQECNFDVYSAQALAKALCKKSRLRSLHITESTISVRSMLVLAAILRANVKLEEIQLSGRWSLPFRGVAELCSALTEDNTLKKLTLGKFRATKQEREALAQTLTTSNSYGRVQLFWAKPDVHGLCNVLISPTASPEELSLHNTHSLTEESLRLLFDAIGSSERVHTFRVLWRKNVRTKGAAFCEMLKSNRSIRTLDIFIATGTGNLAHSVMRALAENGGIAKVMIGIETVERVRTAADIFYFLVRNKTATSFYLSVSCCLPPELVKKLSKGMWHNRLIVDFKLSADLFCNNRSFAIFEAMRRNKATLNRAVDFILSHKADRECAEAFELFSKTPVLVSHTAKVAGKTEGEVLVHVVSAANFLTDNYLTITGVVQNSVACHPAQGTQIAALNKDCWRAICRNLRVTDVLVP